MKLSDFIERCERVSNFTDAACIHTLISDLKIINESQKAKVPNFIGDWIFKAQLVDDLSLCVALEYTTIKLYAKNSEEILKWLEIRENQETFARAWLDGYTVEKEKRYLVKMKGLEIDEAYLKFQSDSKYWYMGIMEEYQHAKAKHTRKELEEAGFGDVFNSQLFEVKEVEE